MTTKWIALILGVWIMVSPWLLGFSSITVMMWSDLLVGLVLVLMNVWLIFGPKEKNKV